MGAVTEHEPHVATLRAERNLYRGLLELGRQDELEPFINAALAMVADLARARYGYLELRNGGGTTTPGFWLGHGDNTAQDLDTFRGRISRSVIDESVRSGRPIVTASALTDPRFAKSGSVKRQRIEAVLCVPIGSEPVLGAIYLQGREEPGPFSAADRERVEMFATHLAGFAERILLRHRDEHSADPTASYRASLNCAGVIGKSQAIAGLLKQLTIVAPHSVGVLISGPTGTGKTQIARVLHMSGPRADQPFVELNCAALPETLVENELFGSAAGAHSTATRDTPGKIAAAHQGTLFLDEVGELPLSSQAKLLQFLQSGDYYPLGSASPRRADVRIIAASNVDLKQAVAEKRFREDLYYRLHIVPVSVPSLAARAEDIPLLAAHFCQRACERNGLAELVLSGAALAAVEVEEWPGNVRQLAHTVEAASLRAAAEGVEAVQVRHLFPEHAATSGDGASPTFQEAVASFKEKLLRATLSETDGNVSEAARRLDLARSQVNKLIRRFEIGVER